MAGLLGDVLPYVYSRGNALQRLVGGLLSDPVGSVQQAGGLLQDQHRKQENLLAQAFQNQSRPFQVTDSNALQQASMNMLAGPLGFAPAGITAWHGSPHTFDKFDSSKIGTGEGAQAYGHGLYLAESPEVAKSYQSALSAERGFSYGGKAGLTRQQVQDLVNTKQPGYLDGVMRPSGVADAVMDDMVTGAIRAEGQLPRSYKPGTERAKAYEQLRREIQHADPGALYKVDLPDDAIAKMLDWDKPLSQQPREVQQAAQRLGITDARNGEDLMWKLKRTKFDVRDSMAASTNREPHVFAAETLRQQGIPGVRYLDGGSRGAGSGSSNFVVFPGEENMLKILERNGQPLR